VIIGFPTPTKPEMIGKAKRKNKKSTAGVGPAVLLRERCCPARARDQLARAKPL
jgi:hypothetical protein